jgi:serine/threonine-protein kinase
MGEVWCATDTNLSRQVAIKVLPDAFAQDPDRLARFEHEAKTLASLNHPNIAQIYGLEKTDSIRALVMELVEGPTLADRIAQRPIPVDEALPIAKQIAEALEAAHEQGIIHRDLKPANIKVRSDGTVKVLDFGLAKALEPVSASNVDATASPTITSPAMMTGVGVLLGTAAYMSPEQTRGKAVDTRTDIWAFGCVLYEMLTGKRAFSGDEVSDVLASVLAREPDWTLLPPGLSPVIGTYLKRCLHKDRKQRIGDAQSLRLALEGAFETGVFQAAQLLAVTQPGWRRAFPVAAALVVGALLVGVTAWSLWPTVAPPAVNRFEFALPADQGFRRVGRPVLALSPDGRRVVYNTGKGLYLRNMGELEARLIPGTEENLTTPFFSPDGQSVGYYAAAGGNQLKRIAITGGAPVRIADAVNPFGASWSADGTILFGQPKGIMRVSANGGTPELVIPAKEGEQVDSPQLLPDGDSVLFTVTTASGSTRWDQAQIVVQSLSTGARTVMVQGGSDARYVPTGHLIYASEESLFAVAFDPASRSVSGGALSVVQGVARALDPAINTATANYGVSNDGALVYVAGGLVDFRLAWVDRQGRETPLAAPTRPYAQPRVSPDGSRVAVVVDGDISVWDNVRSTLTRLTFDASEEVSPLWTADGTRIAFASRDKGIFWKASDGTDESQRLLDSLRARPSAWALDGTLLYDDLNDIWRLSMAGTPKAERLLATNFVETRPALSPDGRWLAYESNESGQFEIYVRPFPDISRGRWLVSTSGGVDPLWAPDGHALFYRAPSAGLQNQRLMSVTVESKDASFVAHAPESLFSDTGINVASDARNYDVAPDGERFLFAKASVRASNYTEGSPFSRIIIVENWFEELKRLVPTK